MGLVPWVLRAEAIRPDAHRTLPSEALVRAQTEPPAPEQPEALAGADVQASAHPQSITPAPVSASATGFDLFPDDQSALAGALAGSEVCVVPRRGVSASESALKGRIVLLLESRHTVASPLPIDGHTWDLDKQEEQLLMAMLRSIGLVENDLCRTVPAVSVEARGDELSSTTVAELHRQVPRLVLLLLNRFDASLTPAQHRLEGSAGVTGWRLPHPAVLLQTPSLKRQAWEVLKLIRQTLSS